jgi:predicted CDP-diglyceride synthetase/phosphatidate cytidylyltransferase
MRKMKHKKTGTILNVVEHVITKNYWEYYITDEHFNDDIVAALVMGFETEIGDISLSEIKPYMMTRTKDLSEVMPAEGWHWVTS